MGIASPEYSRYLKYNTAPVTVALSTTTATSAQLTEGIYELWCSVDCFFLQGGAAVVATLTSVPYTAKTVKEIHIETAVSMDYVAAILAAATATLFLTRRKDR